MKERLNQQKGKVEYTTTSCPEPLMPGWYIDSSVLAHELYLKYSLGVPFNRNEPERCKCGVDITSDDLYTWSIKMSERRLSLLLPVLWDHLLDNPERIIQADETPHLVLRIQGKEPGAKSYIWVYSTCAKAKHPIHIYCFEPGRSGDFPADKLLRFLGYLVSDAFSGYNKVAGVIRVLCWIHARRKFVEAYPADSKLIPLSKQFRAVEKIDKLFEEDAKMKDYDPEKRKAERERLMRPIVNELYNWFDEIRPSVAPKSKLDTAINYCTNHRKELEAFFLDGNLPIHNQLSEQSIRGVAVGRKNYLFYGSPRGATAGACYYTLVETAEKNGLDAELYLKFLMDNMKNESLLSVEYLETLLPWASPAQEQCKLEVAWNRGYRY